MMKTCQTPKSGQNSPFVRIPEVMHLLEPVVSRSTFYRAVKAGTIPSVRIGGSLLIPRSWLSGLFQQNGGQDREQDGEQDKEQDR